MSNELKQALTEFMKALLEGMKKGTELASNEIPLVIKEVLKYNLIVDCLMLVVFAALAGVMIYFSNVAKRSVKTIYDEDLLIVGWGITATSIVPIFFFISYLTEVLKIIFAPRLFIIEWLKGMM